MVTILREADERSVPEVAKKHGVSAQTIYAWRKHFGSLEPTDVKRLRQLNWYLEGTSTEEHIGVRLEEAVRKAQAERPRSESEIRHLRAYMRDKLTNWRREWESRRPFCRCLRSLAACR